MIKDGRVRVGLAGPGRTGRFHAAYLAGRIPGAYPARIVDANQKSACDNAEQLGAIGWSAGYDDLLDEPEIEAIIVASPTPPHAGMGEAAARAGKQAFCEKPLSLGLDRTYEVIGTVRFSGVKMQVVFDRRFDADYRVAWEKVSSEATGDVYLFRTSLGNMWSLGFDYIRGSGEFFVTLRDFDAARWPIGEIFYEKAG